MLSLKLDECEHGEKDLFAKVERGEQHYDLRTHVEEVPVLA